MEDLFESLSLPFLATAVVVGTIILVRLDKISRRRQLEASEPKGEEPPREEIEPQHRPVGADVISVRKPRDFGR